MESGQSGHSNPMWLLDEAGIPSRGKPNALLVINCSWFYVQESVNVLQSWRDTAYEAETSGQTSAVAAMQKSEHQVSPSSIHTGTSPVPFIPGEKSRDIL